MLKLLKKYYSNYLIYKINKSLDFAEGREVIVFETREGERYVNVRWRMEDSSTTCVSGDYNDNIGKRIKYINKLRKLEE